MILHIVRINTDTFLVDFKFLMYEAKIIKVIINTIYIYTYNYIIYFYGNNYDKYYNHYAKDFLTLDFIPLIMAYQRINPISDDDQKILTAIGNKIFWSS